MLFTCKRTNFISKLAKGNRKQLLCELSDPCITSASIPVNAGNRVASGAIANAEATLEFKKIMGYDQSHRPGFASIFPRCHKKLLYILKTPVNSARRS